jgi:hypothetical protein
MVTLAVVPHTVLLVSPSFEEQVAEKPKEQ